jgi:FlaA1/EpsC-like NDP-sugar epimerase
MLATKLLYVTRRLVVHLVLLSGCFVAAYLVHFEGRIPELQRRHLAFNLALAVGTMLLGLVWARVYRKLTDYASLRDFLCIARGAALATLVLLCTNSLIPPPLALPWPVLVVYFLLSTAILSVSLFTVRIWRESPLAQAQRYESGALRPLVIYGAGRAGSMVAREILQSPELGYELIGFFDDDPEKWGKEINGACVLGGRHDLTRFIGPELRELVLAIPSLDADDRREILTWCRRAGAHVRIVPGLAELLRGTSVLQQIRDVRVEDLLPREAVELDDTEVRHLLEGEVVLVTGAAGSIGSELCHQILRHAPQKLLLVEQSESRLFYLERDLAQLRYSERTEIVPLVADIGDRERMSAILHACRPAHKVPASDYEIVLHRVFPLRFVPVAAKSFSASASAGAPKTIFYQFKVASGARTDFPPSVSELELCVGGR